MSLLKIRGQAFLVSFIIFIVLFSINLIIKKTEYNKQFILQNENQFLIISKVGKEIRLGYLEIDNKKFSKKKVDSRLNFEENTKGEIVMRIKYTDEKIEEIKRVINSVIQNENNKIPMTNEERAQYFHHDVILYEIKDFYGNRYYIKDEKTVQLFKNYFV